MSPVQIFMHVGEARLGAEVALREEEEDGLRALNVLFQGPNVLKIIDLLRTPRRVREVVSIAPTSIAYRVCVRALRGAAMLLRLCTHIKENLDAGQQEHQLLLDDCDGVLTGSPDVAVEEVPCLDDPPGLLKSHSPHQLRSSR